MAMILLIDDEPTARLVLAQLLKRHGHFVLEAANGRVALAAAAKAAFDLVITDVAMPGMDGLEVMAQLGKTHPGLPVIAISGQGRAWAQELEERGGPCGPVAALHKPFDVLEFMGAVDLALDAGRGVEPVAER